MTPSIAPAPPPAASAADVPVLDLAPLLAGEDIDGLAREVRRACEGMGFFYIRNHGVPAEVIEGAFAASRRFFEQPLDARMKIHKDRFTAAACRSAPPAIPARRRT
jgi:isopenicillin N synthase-like dioxygenase